MDTFWKWLMHANARGVLAASLVGLAGVGGWWGWKEFAPQADIGASIPYSQAREIEETELDVLDVLDEHTLAPTAVPGHNPFLPSASIWRYKPKWQRRSRPPRTPPPNQVTLLPFAVTPNPEPDRPAPPPSPGPNVARPKPVTLEYCGFFRRTDGTRVALIRDSKTDRKRFYRVDSDVFGATVKSISETGVTIVDVAGERVILKHGESADAGVSDE